MWHGASATTRTGTYDLDIVFKLWFRPKFGQPGPESVRILHRVKLHKYLHIWTNTQQNRQLAMGEEK